MCSDALNTWLIVQIVSCSLVSYAVTLPLTSTQSPIDFNYTHVD